MLGPRHRRVAVPAALPLEWTDEPEQRFAAQEEECARKREALKAKGAKQLARQQRKEAAEAAAGP